MLGADEGLQWQQSSTEHESLMEERNELTGGTQAIFSMWKVVF